MLKESSIVVILIVVIFCLSGCGNELPNSADVDNTNSEVGTEIENESQKDVYLEAELELKEMFDYYSIDLNLFVNEGVTVISNNNFIYYKSIDVDGYSFYINLDQNYDIYGGYPYSGMDCWWSNGEPCFDSDFWLKNTETTTEELPMITSYVPMTIGVLDKYFDDYLNQTGARYIADSKRNQHTRFWVESLEDVNYYLETNTLSLVGVRNGEISLFCGITTGNSRPYQVRDVINELGFYDLFEVQPTICEIYNSNNYTREFVYWKVSNGYIGFVISAGTESFDNCYSYLTTGFIICENLDYIRFAN